MACASGCFPLSTFRCFRRSWCGVYLTRHIGMRIEIITTFPGIIEAVAGESILGRAQKRGILDLEAVDLREFAHDTHRSTDDEPYGGGPGMVMKCEPVFEAVETLTARRPTAKPRVLLMTPQGATFDQKMAEHLAVENYLIIICGRYEGVDERIRENLVTDEVSIGDYVLTGGEVPALVVVEAVVRLIPGVLGDETSPLSESFSSGLLDHPQYTRPADFRGIRVPDVLLSGNHEETRKWRRSSALERTLKRRPDLIETAELTGEDRRFLGKIEKPSDPEEESSGTH